MAAPVPGEQLFVYYRVPEALLTATVLLARQMQAGLRQRWPALQAGLLRRPELRDGEVTLMECYAGVPRDLLQPALGEAASALPLPLPRHSERFIPLD